MTDGVIVTGLMYCSSNPCETHEVPIGPETAVEFDGASEPALNRARPPFTWHHSEGWSD